MRNPDGLAKRITKAWALLRNSALPGTRQHRSTAERRYASAENNRLTADWSVTNSSADNELVSSLTNLRARSRALIRDVSYAKRAQVVVVNNVIGTGIGMQAQVKNSRGELRKDVNNSIEREWQKWCKADSCHTGGRLAFKHLERALMAQVFSAGEAFIRKHRRAFGNSQIPYALELIEAERIADELSSPFISQTSGNEVRMGIELDEFHRPVAYYIRRRHKNETRFGGTAPDAVERVPAADIIHLAVIERWPQTRGEPWMHAVAGTFNAISAYTDAEITRARVQASTPWTIETPADGESFGEEQEDGSIAFEVEPGVAKRLAPGEEMKAPSTNSPNPAMEGFMRYMLREISAGAGPSYSSISRDYSQSTYSSERVAQLDDRDTWRAIQSFFICDFRYIVHREWLQQAVFAHQIAGIKVEQYANDIDKFEAVLFKPRGWTWVDPTKEVEAYKEAIRAGFTTRTDVIAATAGGQDIEDVDSTRERELEQAKERGLEFDTDPDYYMSDAAKNLADAKNVAKAAKPPYEGDTPNGPEEKPDKNNEDPPARRVFSFRRS